MMNLIDWCNTNNGFTSLVLSVVMVFITLYVMCRSNKNSKTIAENQAKMEREFALRQEDMQKRQIKVDTYPYRLECWRRIYKLENGLYMLKMLYTTLDFNTLTYGDLYFKYEKLALDFEDICFCLRQARSVFAVKSWGYLEKVEKCYAKINDIFNEFSIISTYYNDEEKLAVEPNKDAMVKNLRLHTEWALQAINKVKLTLNEDMCISDLHSWTGLYDAKNITVEND